MKVLTTLSPEIIGLIFLLVSSAISLSLPKGEDFWLAVATSISLFLIMFIRLNLSEAAPKEDKKAP
jgi:hypothetical protein